MVVLSLFDFTGIMVQPWAEAGYDCICVDILHPIEGKFTEYGKGTISYIRLDLSAGSSDWDILFSIQNVAMIFGFPVCTDLSISGAKHWKEKREENSFFQHNAILPATNIVDLADKLSVRYMIENPRSALCKLWRKEDYTFHPYEYGKYLPTNSPHPLYPTIIPAQDAYEKLTCIWAGNGFIMPPKEPTSPEFVLYRFGTGEIKRLSPIMAKTGGSSPKTKAIRSATPRGFAQAVYYFNGLKGGEV